MENLIVYLIGLIAVLFVARKAYKTLSGKSSGCSCGCGGSGNGKKKEISSSGCGCGCGGNK